MRPKQMIRCGGGRRNPQIGQQFQNFLIDEVDAALLRLIHFEISQWHNQLHWNHTVEEPRDNDMLPPPQQMGLWLVVI